MNNDEQRARIESLADRVAECAGNLAGACRVLSDECVRIEMDTLRLEMARLLDTWEHMV